MTSAVAQSWLRQAQGRREGNKTKNEEGTGEQEMQVLKGEQERGELGVGHRPHCKYKYK